MMSGTETVENVSLERCTTRFGDIFINSKTDAKMLCAFRKGIYPNESLIQFARHVTTSRSVVVDIGAHIGTFTVPITESVNSVIAFEPAPATLAILRKNIEHNSIQVDVRTVGLSNLPGSASIETRKAENAGANTLVSGSDIILSTLDAEVTRADFIKIDVEGMELEVLEGGSVLIDHARPIVYFEVNLSQLRAHHTSPQALEYFFKKRNYRLYFLLEDKHHTQ
ncbi:MAG: FkbM family methyltransferase, partial [Patescibacteria group bacterium]